MISIYDKDNNEIQGTEVLRDLLITKDCQHVEELMKSDYVELSWNDTERYTLPVGANITPFPNEVNRYDPTDSRYPVRYRLFEPYMPDCKNETQYEYKPQFEHPIMWLKRIPFMLITGDTTGWETATKKTSWGYTGSAYHIASFITDTINWLADNYPYFDAVIGGNWFTTVDSDLLPSATVNFESVDIFSAAGNIAAAFDCEFHFDFARRNFRVGTVKYGTNVELKTGVNVGVADVSRTKKDFYNAFLVKGSTKNLSQPTDTGENLQVLERLTLDSDKYPDSIMYTDDEGEVITREEFEALNVPMLLEELIFDTIYPKLELYLYNIRERKCWLLDDRGNRTEDPNGEYDEETEKYYKSYSKWYIRLAYPVYEDGELVRWEDYKIEEGSIIDGQTLQMSFLVNDTPGAYNSLLVGQGDFNLVYFDKETTEKEDDDIDPEGFTAEEGDYRIEFKQTDNLIIPTSSKGGLYPLPIDTDEPSVLNNKATLINIVVDDDYKKIAQQELEKVAKRKVALLRSDLNNYTLPSNPAYFEEYDTKLFLGQSVTYNDGQDLTGGISYVLNTHVIKIVTQIDFPFIQEITVGNEKIKKDIVTLQEKVSAVVANATSGIGGWGTIDEDILLQMLKSYGADLFLSKVNDDVAQGVIGFLRGAWFGFKNWMIDGNGNANLNDIIANGQLTANHAQSTNYTGDGMFDTGYLLQYAKGKAKLVIDDIICRGKFVVNEIEDRIWTYAGGNLIFSAAGSTIFYVEYLDAQDQPLGYTYINSPWLLNKIPLLARVIAWSKRRQIQGKLSPEDKLRVVKFRCYETSDDGTMQTRNWWHVNDIALCQTLNRVKNKSVTSGGYSGSLSNTVYRRRVAGIGSKRISLINDNKIYDYVDLWNVLDVRGRTYIDKYGNTQTITDEVPGYDEGYEDWPAAGDVIVQRGNVLDEERQGFSTVEVTGTQRGFKVYDGVYDYSMEGKKRAFIGYDADKERAQLEVFGDAYIGTMGTGPDVHDGSTYIRFDASRRVLEIKAKIDASCTVDDQAIDDYINGLIKDITDAIQTQVDQKAETWYQAADPSLNWTTAEERNEHVGDLWHNTTNNKTYFYEASGWKEQYIPDDVFDTIDGKASVYVSQPSSYKAKDLWILSANATVGGVSYKKGELLTASQDSNTFVGTHWTKKVLYTDDSVFLEWKAAGYANDLTNTRNLINQAEADASAAANAASNAQSTANTAKNAAEALDYVKDALKEDTIVEGGLILATLIALRKNSTTWAGINGAYQSANTIAAWFGGGMVDRKQSDGTYSNTGATSLFRMDGSGYFAGGKINWDATGNAKFDGTIEAAGGHIGGFIINSWGLGTQSVFDQSEAAGNIYLGNNGKIYVFAESGYAINAGGGMQVDASLSQSQIDLQNNGNIVTLAYNGGTTIKAKSGNVVSIGVTGVSGSILEVASTGATVNGSTNMKGNVTLGKTDGTSAIELNGSLACPDLLIIGRDTKNLPSSPSDGQVVFCKGTVGAMTVNGNGKQIVQADRVASESVSSVNIGTTASIFIYSSGPGKWLQFNCQ